MGELLLEIFSEEIPARMQAKAAEDLQRLVVDGLKKQGLVPEVARSYVTPRRLVLVITGLPAAAPDVSEEKRGPRVGAPANAVDGFLKGAGVTLEECEQRDTGKGVFYFAVINRPGRATLPVAQEVIEAALADFPWPKSQRWGAHSVRWVRPIQSILALFEGAVVPVSFGPVTAGNSTRGHRFLAPAVFEVSDYADYANKLRKAFVLLDPTERRHLILAGAEKLAEAAGTSLKPDEGLLAEVTGLVEWPVVLAGKIDEAFLDVPKEVLITSMRSHQKYFSALTPDGALAPLFVVASNQQATDGGKAIVAGNERVLRARLSDAKFFWDTDRKHSLESRLPKLAERLFYARLGTVADKVTRLRALARKLADYVEGANAGAADRAAQLAKADLSSEMVGEFPELQGIMGRYYALNDGEDPDVALALAEHYSPLGPNDICPRAPLSVVVSLADKLDSLTGFFAIDEKPTGSKDPFALRRAALGIIRLIVENGLRLPLKAALAAAYSQFGEDLPRGKQETVADLLDFFADRLKVHLKEQGVRHDLVSAIFSQGGSEAEDDLVRLLARVAALSEFVASDDGANLLIAYRRAANIVRIEEKKDGRSFDGVIESGDLVQDEEKALAAALDAVTARIDPLLQDEDYRPAMAALAGLRAPVDSFFEKVTVNAEDVKMRENRLKLLARIGATMGRVADFSKLEG